MAPGHKMADNETWLTASPDSNHESDQIPAAPKTSTPSTPNEVQPPAAPEPPRRSNRIRQPPGYLSDYVR